MIFLQAYAVSRLPITLDALGIPDLWEYCHQALSLLTCLAWQAESGATIYLSAAQSAPTSRAIGKYQGSLQFLKLFSFIFSQETLFSCLVYARRDSGYLR